MHEPPTLGPKPDQRPSMQGSVASEARIPDFGYRYAAAGSEPAKESGFQKRISEHTESARVDFERFIGENLISKIGIVVLIIGVGIGVKYSIDNNLISPLTRIILGYAIGFGIAGLAIRLKAKYHNFSAALLSGGFAIMYFVTFFGYSAYGLISQPAAFGLMAMFTALTVTAALVYNRQVIAHIGLVGAYAVPFLLSNDTGNYLFLFAYMAVTNSGILAVSIKRYWTPIFYTASAFTWLIFFGWFTSKYTAESHFALALAFAGIFGTIFYATKVIHTVVYPEHNELVNKIFAAATAVILFAFAGAISLTAEEVGQYWMMFGFLAVFGAAAAATSFRYFGRSIAYIAFFFCWFSYAAWFGNAFTANEHTSIATVFAVLFFAVFYVATIAYRTITPGMSAYESAGLLLTNSFIFYGFGYAIMDSYATLSSLLGLFTVAHGAFHFGVAAVVGRWREDSDDLVLVLTVLTLTFAAIAVPVQFDGNLVTMVWAAEAAFLFFLGRIRRVPVLEYFSFPVMLLATGSMIVDWGRVIEDRTLEVSELNRQPLANGDFVTALVFAAAFGFIFWIDRSRRDDSPFAKDIAAIIGGTTFSIALFALYNAFRLEIENYFHLRAVSAGSATSAIKSLNVIWQLNYTIAFLTAVAAVNLTKVGSRILAAANTVLGIFALFGLATLGSILFIELRQMYIGANDAAASYTSHIAVRYVSYTLAGLLIYGLYRYVRSGLLEKYVPEEVLRLGFEGALVMFVLVIASGDLLNLMAQFEIPDGSKLGLSILWVVFALVLIAYGIARSKKHLRVGAIGLITVTLVKLFFYDAADLPTIPKTILFVTIGITLLAASFLYNKYRAVLARDDTSAEIGSDV